MNVIVVDDERIILQTETLAAERVLPKANIRAFREAKEAVAFAEENRVDIAFLDINMKGITGLDLAKKLRERHPKVNIIFCTGYSEYSLDALDLYCSGYLLKPVTDEKMKTAIANLRFPIREDPEEKIPGLRVQCFGNFEVFLDGEPIRFRQKKTKELFAYLVDRRGSTVSTREIVAALYTEEENKDSYVRNLRSDLNATFLELGISDALSRSGANVGVNTEKVACDYFDYLAGDKSLFRGEYMSQYSFAEETLARLTEEKDGKD